MLYFVSFIHRVHFLILDENHWKKYNLNISRKISKTRHCISLRGHVMHVKRNTTVHDVRKHKIPKCAIVVHITNIVCGQEFLLFLFTIIIPVNRKQF